MPSPSELERELPQFNERYEINPNNKGQWCVYDRAGRGFHLVAICLDEYDAVKIRDALNRVWICPKCGSRDGEVSEVRPSLEI